MKRRMWVLVLGVACFFGFSNAAWAASTTLKIGYFDLQQVLEKSTPGKQAKESFKDQKEKVRSEMEEKARAFKTAKEEFEKKKSVMDQSARDKKTKEIEKMQQEGEKLIMESNAKLNKLSNELMAPIVDKVLEIVRKIGKDKKYDFVMEAGKGGFVYANDEFDLTKTIIDELDRSPIKR